MCVRACVGLTHGVYACWENKVVHCRDTQRLNVNFLKSDKKLVKNKKCMKRKLYLEKVLPGLQGGPWGWGSGGRARGQEGGQQGHCPGQGKERAEGLREDTTGLHRAGGDGRERVQRQSWAESWR